MKRFIALIGPLFGGILVLGFVLLSLKGCVVTVWRAPEQAIHYAVVGADRRTLEITVFPDHEVILWYTDPSRQYLEGTLQKWKGSEGTHYFGRLWHIEGPGTTFGYRFYPAGLTPVMMEQTTLKTFRSSAGHSTFPEEGERGHSVLLFSEDSLVFGGMTLVQAEPDPEQLELRKALLGKSEVGNTPAGRP